MKEKVMQRINTEDLKNLNAFEIQKRLSVYTSYENALEQYPNLEHILIRLGYECSPEEAFIDFINMDREKIFKRYQVFKLTHLPIDLSLNFIIKKIVQVLQKERPNTLLRKDIERIFGLDAYKIKCKVAQYVLIQDLSSKAAENIFADYIFDNINFITLDEFVLFIKEIVFSAPEDIDLVTYIANQFQEKEIVPLNEHTIIRHAIYHNNLYQFCLSFNGSTSVNMKKNLENFKIYSQKNRRYVTLTPKLLFDTIEKIRENNPLCSDEDLFNLVSELTPLIILDTKKTEENFHDEFSAILNDLREEPSDVQEIHTMQKYKKLKPCPIENDAEKGIIESGQTAIQYGSDIYYSDLYEGLALFLDNESTENSIQNDYNPVFFATQAKNNKRKLEAEESKHELSELDIDLDLLRAYTEI